MTGEGEEDGDWINTEINEEPVEADTAWGGVDDSNLSVSAEPLDPFETVPPHPFETMDVNGMLKELRDLQAGRLRKLLSTILFTQPLISYRNG